MKALSRIHQRVSSLKRQRGFLRLSMLIPRWSSKGFSVQDGFRQSEPGLHLETYDPNTILKRRNLLTQSENVAHTDWGLNSGITVSSDVAIAPDGLATADRIVETATTASHAIQRALVGVRNGEVSTLSIYVKAGERSFAHLGSNNTTDFAYATINLTTGAVSIATDIANKITVATSEDAGNGWWRFIVSLTPNSTGVWSWDLRMSADGVWANRSYAGDITKGMYVWGGQCDKGAVTPYQKVTDWNTEFLGGDPLVRRNLLLNTSSTLALGATYWGSTGLSSVLQANGSALMTRTTTAAGAYAEQTTATNAALALAVGTTVTFSIRAKKATTGNLFGVRVQSAYPQRADAVVNLDTGAVTYSGGNTLTGISAVVDAPDADGFRRIALTATIAGSAMTKMVFGPAFVSNGSWEGTSATLIDAYVKEPQVEVGALATSYQKITDWTTEYAAQEVVRLAQRQMVTMFQDPTCQLPVTAVEQVIGGFISSERGTVRGPEQWSDAATTFLGGSSKVSTGVYRIFTPDGSVSQVSAGTPLTVNDYYEITFNVDSVATAGSGFIAVGNAVEASVTLSVGQKRCVIRTTTNAPVIKRSGASAQDFQISNVSWKRIPGAVAGQSTAGFKPKLEARVNVLTKTEQFTDAVWGKTDVTVVDRAANDGFGAATLCKITEGTTSGNHYVSQAGGVVANAPVVGSATFKLGTRGFAEIRLQSTNGACRAYINLTTGALTAVGVLFGTVWSSVSAASAAEGDGSCYRVTLRGTSSDANPGLYLMSVNSTPSDSYVGDGVSYFYAGKIDLRTAADAALDIPAYQRVNTATDYDTDGFPHRCRGDGSDDYLSVPLNMSTVNAVDVWVSGSLKTNDTGDQMVYELTTQSSSTPGGFRLVAPSTAATNSYSAASHGNSAGAASATTVAGAFPAPRNDVVFVGADIPADVVAIEVNGVPAIQGGADQGAGNYANDTLYILRRAGSTLASNCGFCAMTIRGGARSDSSFKARMLRLHARLSKIKV